MIVKFYHSLILKNDTTIFDDYNNLIVYLINRAKVAELVDAHDSKSCFFGSVGSSPTFGTYWSEYA